MKRTVPLLIAAMAGYVLVSSRFIPLAEKWGEVEAIWFDVLAAIAFVLGGGLELRISRLRLSGELRWLRWGSPSNNNVVRLSQNEGEVLFGFVF